MPTKSGLEMTPPKSKITVLIGLSGMRAKCSRGAEFGSRIGLPAARFLGRCDRKCEIGRCRSEGNRAGFLVGDEQRHAREGGVAADGIRVVVDGEHARAARD